MAKNILAFFGLIFLTLLIVGGVGLMGYLYDSVGIVELPQEVGVLADRALTIPERLRPQAGTPTIQVNDGGGEPVRENPLDLLPIATATIEVWTPIPTEPPPPTPTNTPIPPMEPSMYRADTLDRLRALADVLERWLDHNKKMGGDQIIMHDPQWQTEMRMLLDEIVYAAYGLDQIGPPPLEYAVIDDWMGRLPGLAETLRSDYQRALETGDPDAFRAAGEDFNAIRETLTHAAEEMVNLGWSLE